MGSGGGEKVRRKTGGLERGSCDGKVVWDGMEVGSLEL